MSLHTENLKTSRKEENPRKGAPLKALRSLKELIKNSEDLGYPDFGMLPLDQTSLFSRDERGYEAAVRIINAGQLEKIPPDLLTKDNLLKHTEIGNHTILSIIIASGQLEKLPKELLTKDLLLEGWPTCGLIESIHYECLHLVPKSVLADQQILELADPLGNTVLHIACEKKQIGVLLDNALEFITEARMVKPNKEGWTPLHYCCNNETLEQVPKELRTKKNLSLRTRTGLSPLHSIAMRKLFHLVNKDVIDKENIWLKNMHDMTIAHTAAKFGTLEDIDSKVLTKELLECPDNDNNTVYHLAAKSGYFQQIPKDLVSKECKSLKNRNGCTIFHEAASTGNLDKLPEALIDPANLLETNIYGENCFDIAQLNTHIDILIDLLPTKTLKSCLPCLQDESQKNMVHQELKKRQKKMVKEELRKEWERGTKEGVAL